MIYMAVIDTNILISALLSKKEDSATVKIIEKLISGVIIPVYSKEILSEYREVLSRKKFSFSQDTIGYLLSAIEKFGILVQTSEKENISLPDVKDIPFYKIIKENSNVYLVTGNTKHFPTEPFIVTARQMINLLEEANSKSTETSIGNENNE